MKHFIKLLSISLIVLFLSSCGSSTPTSNPNTNNATANTDNNQNNDSSSNSTNNENTDKPEPDDIISKDTINLYDVDPNTFEVCILESIQIDDSMSLNDKLNITSEKLIQRKFDGLSYDINVENIKNENIVIINLIERNPINSTPSWYQYFQGSTGGFISSNILIDTLLQKDYEGNWIDGIKFYYNGEEITEDSSEFQHAPELIGIIYR